MKFIQRNTNLQYCRNTSDQSVRTQSVLAYDINLGYHCENQKQLKSRCCNTSLNLEINTSNNHYHIIIIKLGAMLSEQYTKYLDNYSNSEH